MGKPFLEGLGVETFTGVPIDYNGNALPESPENTLHLAAAYTWDFLGGTLTARWDYYWQDSMKLSVFDRVTDHVDSWDQHNAMLVYETGDGRWSVRAWVQNIEDDLHITGGARTSLQVAVSDPRSFGASVRYNFGAR